MLVIRLKRVGKKKQAFFRLALQEKTWAPKGKAIELLGFYNPHNKEKTILNAARIEHWISKGAQTSPTVHNLLIDAGVIQGEKVQAWKPKKRDKQQETSDTEQPPKKEDAPQASSGQADDEAVEPDVDTDRKESGKKTSNEAGAADTDAEPEPEPAETQKDAEATESEEDVTEKQAVPQEDGSAAMNVPDDAGAKEAAKEATLGATEPKEGTSAETDSDTDQPETDTPKKDE